MHRLFPQDEIQRQEEFHLNPFNSSHFPAYIWQCEADICYMPSRDMPNGKLPHLHPACLAAYKAKHKLYSIKIHVTIDDKYEITLKPTTYVVHDGDEITINIHGTIDWSHQKTYIK